MIFPDNLDLGSRPDPSLHDETFPSSGEIHNFAPICLEREDLLEIYRLFYFVTELELLVKMVCRMLSYLY